MPSLLPFSLETERLRIRFLQPDDAAAQFALYSDPVAMRFWSSAPWVEQQQAHDQINKSLQDYADGSSARLAIALRSTGEVIGNVSLHAFDDVSRRCSLGYMLLRTEQGKGYMTEALRAAIGHAFGSLNINRIEADIDPRNLPSIRLLERIGFRCEGVMPERWIVGGEVCDTVFYGLLSRHWTR